MRSRSRSPRDHSPDRGGRDSSRGRRSRDTSRRNRAPSDRRVYVANIPFDLKWTDVKDLFREKVGDVSYVELFEDESGKFRGCGIVELKDKSSVPKAIEVLHRYEMKGRFLVVKEDFDVERDRHGRPLTRRSGNGGGRMSSLDRDNGGRHSGGGGGMGGGFNTYGLSPQFLDSLGIVGPLSNRVFVANLDYKVTSKKLQEIFRLAGHVAHVELRTDKDGNSKGHGIIEFDHPIEAVQAISMFNGQKLFSRPMSVRMDKYNEDLDGLPNKLPSGLQSVGKGLGAGGNPLQINAAAAAAASMSSMGPANPPLGGPTMGMGGVAAMGAGTGMGAGTNLAGMGGMGASMGSMGSMGASMGSMGSMGTMGAMGNMGTMGGMGGLGNMGGLSDRSLMSPTAGLGSQGSSLGSLGGSGGGLGMSGMGGNPLHNMGGPLDYDRPIDTPEYRSPRSSDTIIVQNLPMSYTWQNLRDRFRDVGSVRYTEVKGRGTAVVRFNSERDAQRAVDMMNGIRIENRQIEVRLY